MIKFLQLEKNVQTDDFLKKLTFTMNFSSEKRKLNFKNQKSQNLIKIKEKNDILKSLVFFGQNNVGKSKLINEIIQFKNLILSGKSELPFLNIKIRFFLHHQNDFTETEYILHILNNEIINEELSFFPKKTKVKVFSRFYNDFHFVKGFKCAKIDKFRRYINSDSVFLSEIAQNDFFSTDEKFKIFCDVYNFFINDFIFEKINPEIFITKHNLFLEFLHQANFNILNYQNPYTFYENIQNDSSGTKEFVFTLAKIIQENNSGKLIFLDDFAQNLHPILARFLIKIIHSTKNLQFVINTNSTSLLDTKLFRTEQINFIDLFDFNDFMNKRLYDFKDFRENMNAEKCYLEGRFSATPFIITSENTIRNILNAREKF